LASLRRTEFGDFTVAEATPLAEIVARAPAIWTDPAHDALRSARRVPVAPAQGLRHRQRAARRLADIAPPAASERLAACSHPRRPLAVLEAESGAWALRRVVMPEASQLYRP